MESFNDHCLKGVTANRKQIDFYVKNSLMLVTALNPHIGYDNAALVAKKAFKANISLKEAAVELKLLTEEQFDEFVNAGEMTHH